MVKLLHALRARLSVWAPVLVTTVGLLVTALYWHGEEEEAKDRAEHALHMAADQMTNVISQRLRSYELALRGVKGLMESSQQVTAAEFHRYVHALQLQQIRPGLQGVAFVPHVTPDRLQAFESDMRSVNHPDYRIHPAGQRARYAPIALIEPATPTNTGILGVDLATNPVALAAMDKARDSGQLVLSDALRLRQDATMGQNAPVAAAMYMPIYTPPLPTETTAQRQAALLGWVSGPFRFHDLMSALTTQMNANVHITLYAAAGRGADDVLYRSGQSHASSGTASTTRQLNTGGNPISAVFTASPAFSAHYATEGHLGVALTGAAVSLLLGVTTWLLSTRRDKAMALARNMTHQLQDSQAHLESVLNALPDLLFELDLDGRFISYHTSRLNLLAAPPEAFLGKRIGEVLPEAAAATSLAALAEANRTGLASGHAIHIQTAEGARWFELSVARKVDAHPAEPRFIVISRDVTERKLAETERALSARVFESVHEAAVITDAHNNMVAVNPAFTRLTGYSAQEALGKSPSMLKSGLQPAGFYEDMWRDIQNTGSWQGEVLNRRKDGTLYPQRLSISTVLDDNGRVIQHIGMMSDLTASKAAQHRIDQLAHYDPLTGLPNSVLLHDRGNQAIASAQRKKDSVALLSIDIDRFQKINDSLGMPVGDAVLQSVATRLVAHLHNDDTLCRHSGDEFMVLLPVTSATGAAHVAAKLLALLAEPLVVTGLADDPIILTASMGIALYPDNATDFPQLLQAANVALHRAKQTAGNRFEFFKEDMHGSARETLLIESHLHRALANHELVLHFQPQVDALSGRVVGAEALIRWQHPDWGLVPPGRFIPIAEKSNLIGEISEWVLRTAVRQQAAWMNDGLDIVPVAVNLTALEFRQHTLCQTVQATLAASGLPPAMLELELTESVAMEDTEFTVTQIQSLHALGVKLSIDDFGTGYSSLSYLKRYQVDKLKIDQSFIRDIDNDVSDGTIVRTVISLAHGLGFKTIAEGVETAAQLAFLRQHRCDEIQGYHFSRPVPADAFAALLRAGGVLTGSNPAT